MSIRIALLGGIRIQSAGRDLPEVTAQRQRCALLVYLAVERAATRSVLQRLLWPGRHGRGVRRALATHVRALNRAAGHTIVHLHGERLSLHADVDVDVHAFEQAVDRHDEDLARRLYSGAFLEGVALPDGTEYTYWALTVRGRLAALHERITAAARPALVDETGAVASDVVPVKSAAMRMLAELQRRRVFRVAMTYGTAAFIVIQGVPPVFEALYVPPLATTIVIALLVAAFPFILVLAWAFELTPDGELRRERSTGEPWFSWRGRSPRRLLVAALLVLLLATSAYQFVGRVPLIWSGSLRAAESLDSTRFAILPLQGLAESDSRHGRHELALHDALAQWSGISVINLARDRSARARRAAPTIDQDQQSARRHGAGRLIRGSLTADGDAAALYVALHDVATGELLADTFVQREGGQVPEGAVYDRIAATLLFRSAGIDAPASSTPGTRSLPARGAYQRAHTALLDWDLTAAGAAFAASLEADATFAPAALWLAQVQNWSGRRPSELRAAVERALDGRALLTQREELLARALHDLSRRDFAAACAVYQEVLALNPRDFAGWYGRGECHALDDVVVRDPASRSGFAFRSSQHRGIEAYARAFSLLPSLQRDLRTPMADRARQVLHTSSIRIREGWTEPARTPFLAQPALMADTLAFVPWPLEAHASGRAASSAALSAAVARQRRVFHEIAASWVAAFRGSVDALEALAAAYELIGDDRALPTLREARRNTQDPVRRQRLAAVELSLLLKFGLPDRIADLARARALADSMLVAADSGAAADHQTLATVAALTGRAGSAALHARAGAREQQWRVPIPVSIRAAVDALVTYAALGAPADSIAAYEQAVAAAVRNRIPQDDQRDALNLLLDHAASLAFSQRPLLRTQQLGNSTIYPLLQAQAAFARGDVAAARAIMMRKREVARAVRPAERSFDTLYPDAALTSALGDTITASAELDSTLHAMRWAEPGSIEYPYRAAALVRAMTLRAALAAATNDPVAAARWATPVVMLWGDADPELQPVVERMRALTHAVGDGSSVPRQSPQRGGRR